MAAKIELPATILDQLHHQGFKRDDFRTLKADLRELAAIGLPNARCDWRVESIRCTDGLLYRLKHGCGGPQWRGIIEFTADNKVIRLHLVLRRSPDTYRIVEYYFDQMMAYA